MSRKKQTVKKKLGLPPGSLVHLGDRKAENAKISILEYNLEECTETHHPDIISGIKNRDQQKNLWINVDGLHNTDIVASAGTEFNLHPLLLEDVLNTEHRPKVEEFDDCIFISLKMIGIGTNNDIVTEQLSMVLGSNWLLSFQEQEGDVFEQIRERLRENKGLLRQKGTDYLLYRLLDTVVDNYYYVMEHISDRAELLEDGVLQNANKKILPQIQELKRELMDLKRAINPMREIVTTLQKEENELINESTQRYLRDVYEHIIQINDMLEANRELAGNIMDLYLSNINNRMNEVMKVLTIISTIFIPLSFMVGLYGMNFDNMPELHWRYGYFGVWGVALLTVAGMLYYFKKKRWL